MPTPYGNRAAAGPTVLAPKLLAFCEELRSEGVAVGTSEILDAFEALGQVPWTEEEDFREALAATIAKSQEDRRVFELIEQIARIPQIGGVHIMAPNNDAAVPTVIAEARKRIKRKAMA